MPLGLKSYLDCLNDLFLAQVGGDSLSDEILFSFNDEVGTSLLIAVLDTLGSGACFCTLGIDASLCKICSISRGSIV